MQTCLHDVLQDGSSENSENVCGTDACSVCRRIAHPTRLSCIQCGKNICDDCYSPEVDSQLALYMVTRGAGSITYNAYKECPQSANVLVENDYLKIRVFRMHKEFQVERAEKLLALAISSLKEANASIEDAQAKLNGSQ